MTHAPRWIAPAVAALTFGQLLHPEHEVRHEHVELLEYRPLQLTRAVTLVTSTTPSLR